jgi:hypothetical protein
MTPHPLSVIVARGMSESFTAIGTDPHSQAITVIATGETPIDRILSEVRAAASQQMEKARGTVEVMVPESEPGKGPTKTSKKGPVQECLMKAGVVCDKEGNTVLVCGLDENTRRAAMSKGSLCV